MFFISVFFKGRKDTIFISLPIEFIWLGNMKKFVLLLTIVVSLVQPSWAQQRDRRADLKVECRYHVDVSSTGQLWLADRCGRIWTADSIGATWRTALRPADENFLSGKTFERVAAFGSQTAVAAGFLQPGGFVYRTADGGHHWDTLSVDPDLVWVHGFCYHPDGKLWMASASGRNFQSFSYSEDEGRTFTRLKPTFVSLMLGDDGIEELYMVNATNGFAGTYGNGLYYTDDNWRTAQRIETPLDQNLLEENNYQDTWINLIRPWKQWLVVTESETTAYTVFNSEPHWQALPLPVALYEVDNTLDKLWVITENGQLVLMDDMDHWQVVKDSCESVSSICGTVNGQVYLSTPDGVVRVAPDGRADTCGFFTTERTLQEDFDALLGKYAEYGASAGEILPTIIHGNRLWRTDGNSIYLQDAEGWYRLAKPLNIRKMMPDFDRDDRVVILRNDEKTYSVDTFGHVKPYIFQHPTAAFVQSGLESVTINTYNGGCFHHEDQMVSYARKGNLLREEENTVEEGSHTARCFEADSVEQALLHLGESYAQFPSPEDFGLREGEVNLEEVFKLNGWCTSFSGYRVTFVNRAGDTLTMKGSSDADCGNYFPWLLPMTISWREAAFVSYQPVMWKALRPMMPDNMMLREHLSGFILLRPGDLLFFRDTEGMGAAVKESTGQYTHVALVESVGDTVWIIDATPAHGVSRRPYILSHNDKQSVPDIFRPHAATYDMDSVLIRARSYIGQPYDKAFLPDNGALYCSELIYECFLEDYSYESGTDRHLFKAGPMNWRDANGNLPKYWVKHFKKLKMAVPEGVMGTNPTDLSRSPLLRRL